MNKCDQFRELIEAYALGALDPEERAALEAHLATGCHDCSRAIEEARWLVCQLAYIAPEATPSDRLKGRLMQTVRAEVQSHAQAKPQALPAKRYVPIWLWVAAAAMLLITLSSTWNMRRLEKETREAERLSYELIDGNQRLEKQLAEAKRESMILMDPKSVKIMMPASDKQGTQLEAKWHPQLGRHKLEADHSRMPRVEPCRRPSLRVGCKTSASFDRLLPFRTAAIFAFLVPSLD